MFSCYSFASALFFSFHLISYERRKRRDSLVQLVRKIPLLYYHCFCFHTPFQSIGLTFKLSPGRTTLMHRKPRSMALVLVLQFGSRVIGEILRDRQTETGTERERERESCNLVSFYLC